MKTFAIRQAIANNPGKTAKELAALVELPIRIVRAKITILTDQRLIEPCGTIRHNTNHEYCYRVVQ